MAVQAYLQATDFAVPPYDIPNLPLKTTSFNEFLLKQQEPVMRGLIGNALYNEFAEIGFPVDPGGDAEQKWKDLSNGADYQLEADNTVYRWVGFKELLLPYMYQEWLLTRVEILTNGGAKQAKVENSEAASNVRKLIKANNDFRAKAGDFVWGNSFGPVGSFVHKCAETRNTLYGFLKANYIENYPTAVYVPPRRLNALGL